MSQKTIRYYNVGVRSKANPDSDDYIRLGDKAYALPDIGEYIDIPVRLEKVLKRRYGNGFSRSPKVATQMKVQNAPEKLSNDQLLKEIERLQRIAAERFHANEEGTAAVADPLAELEAIEDPVAQSVEEAVELTEVAPSRARGGKGGNK